MLKLSGVSASYGHISAIDGIGIRVEEGEFIAVLGANGAGKTTLLKVIAGVHVHDAGTIQLFDRPIDKMSVKNRIKAGIGAIPEGRQLFADMSVRENLILGAYPRLGIFPDGAIEDSLERVFSTFPRLRERKAQMAGSLSGGEAQMVAIGRALMSSPRLLLCDEPSLGLAPKLVRDMLKVLSALRDTGTTILLADQNAHASLRLAERGYVLDSGRVIAEGTSAALLADKRLEAAYLGAA
jgi:branched-chain amino acid transport system ATP-binding protein